jgi:hypothetical protein
MHPTQHIYGQANSIVIYLPIWSNLLCGLVASRKAYNVYIASRRLDPQRDAADED